MSNSLDPLSPATAILLVVDMQDRLLPAIHGAEACTAVVKRIVDAAHILHVPVLLTEQYPAGLGRTCASVRDAIGSSQAVEKVRFSACVEPILAELKRLGRKQVLVVGIEAHVCVQQTVLDLLRQGYMPYLCADGVSSRRPMDRDTAIERMRRAEAVVTTSESAIFEMLGQAGTDQFKQILKIVK